MTVSAVTRVHYLVGPNGSGKTRYLIKKSQELGGYFIPKLRQQSGVDQIADNEESYIQASQLPEQKALRLLRENAMLRIKVFSKLSQKLGRDFSVQIVDRSETFRVTSSLSTEAYSNVTLPQYSFGQESAGLREILVLLTLIMSPDYQQILIDEPELSLHPEAQRFLRNEILSEATAGKEFWIATHSPIFFAPESFEELSQALFFSDPQNPEGTRANFDFMTEAQRIHLEKSLLRLDSEKWILAHSKAVVFCEGFRDKAIFRRVCSRLDIDLSRKDISLIETSGKDDFSTLYFLCRAIGKPVHFIGDLDCLVRLKLLDPISALESVKAELTGIDPDLQDYISRTIRHPLGNVCQMIKEARIPEGSELDVELVRKLNSITSVDEMKPIVLEVICRNGRELEKALPQIADQIKLICAAVARARMILKSAGVCIIPSGALETLYQPTPYTPRDESTKRKLFDQEWEGLRDEDPSAVRNRYHEIAEFLESISAVTFDLERFVKREVLPILSRLQTIILETRPQDLDRLKAYPGYKALKIDHLIQLESLDWADQDFVVIGKSIGDIGVRFRIRLSSIAGLNDPNTLVFESDTATVAAFTTGFSGSS